ncbi:hypothetical protein SCLCIDRAFT_1222155 [Scleroderma citrinum Foug A]|uniref:Uncharacterized protein n=1 Tax=Scleroderma citrinum Foug A TaxID=1036808 RepID=A0A0C2ZNV1_9AGAM|nr:hypothetical protein SCLCIDRAFT_1222155 [Scleroderma citrinum Foug A]
MHIHDRDEIMLTTNRRIIMIKQARSSDEIEERCNMDRLSAANLEGCLRELRSADFDLNGWKVRLG